MKLIAGRLQHLQTASWVIRRLRYADTKVTAIEGIGVKIQLQNGPASRSSWVGSDADDIFCTGWLRGRSVSLITL